VLCYKSEGRWFSPRWCHYHSRKPSDHPLVLGSTQPLTEMCTRNIFCGQRRPVRKDDNLPPSWADVRKSGNLNFLEPSGPLQVCNGSALPLPLPDISNNSQRKLLLWVTLSYTTCLSIRPHYMSVVWEQSKERCCLRCNVRYPGLHASHVALQT